MQGKAVNFPHSTEIVKGGDTGERQNGGGKGGIQIMYVV
jgi:hypothetical protein